jgi:hypothetical protein
MNYRGSYRHLLRNGKAAMLAAIEIYNKPRIDYREECCVILLLNAWELTLKALLSKKGRSIFYPKKRNEPYRTLSWRDALSAAEALLPEDLPALPVRRNLGKPFTAHVFQSIAWKYQLKTKPQYCWQAKEGFLTRYSNEVVAWIRSLTASQVNEAIKGYRTFLKQRSKTGVVA